VFVLKGEEKDVDFVGEVEVKGELVEEVEDEGGLVFSWCCCCCCCWVGLGDDMYEDEFGIVIKVC